MEQKEKLIRSWFDDHYRGQIKQMIHKDDQSIVEWYDKDQFGKIHEGLILLIWQDEHMMIKEFECRSDQPYRYQRSSNHKVMWF